MLQLISDLSSLARSINLYTSKYTADEEIGGEEADSACEAEEGVGHYKHVAEVHDHGHHLGNV